MLAPIFGLLFGVAAVAERPSLTGIVRSSDDKPLAGAMVFVYTARPRSGASTMCPSCYLDCRKRAQTDAKGEFVIPSLDPAILFRIGAMAERYQASFQPDVDPAARPVTIRLSRSPAAPDDPRRVLRARIVDGSGAPVLGALVEPVGYRIDHPVGSWDSGFGSIGVTPVITGATGRLSLALPREVDSLFLAVEARGQAPKVFGRVPTGAQENALRLGIGRSIKGRFVQDGRPVSGAVIGTAQVSRDAETSVGDQTAETDANGRFLLFNLPPDEALVVYGKMDSFGGRGALAERETGREPDGAVRDLGDLGLEPGIALSGRVVLADGKPVPPHTRVMLRRLLAWDVGPSRAVADRPTFPTAVERVRLDVIVVDAEGRPVEGLAPSDFQVEENGRQRRIEIESFEPNVVRVATPVLVTPPAPTITATP